MNTFELRQLRSGNSLVIVGHRYGPYDGYGSPYRQDVTFKSIRHDSLDEHLALVEVWDKDGQTIIVAAHCLATTEPLLEFIGDGVVRFKITPTDDDLLNAMSLFKLNCIHARDARQNPSVIARASSLNVELQFEVNDVAA
jgi:hypothetical protein